MRIINEEIQSEMSEELPKQYSDREEALRSQISQLEELYALKESEAVQYRRDVDIMREELKLALCGNADLLENEENLYIELQSFGDKNASLQEIVSSTKNEVVSLIAEILHLRQSADSSNNALAAVKASNNCQSIDRVSKGCQHIKHTTDENEVIIVEIAKLRQEVGAINEDLIAIRDERDSLKRYLGSSTEDLDNSDTDAKNLSQTTESLEKQSVAESPIIEEDQKDAEIANLKEIVSSLKAELKSTPTRESNHYCTVADRLRLQLEETKISLAQEILTLQDEVDRLNQEISTIPIVGQSSKSSVPYPQTSKINDIIIAKDEEIRDFRREIAILRDQLDSTTSTELTDSLSHLQDTVVVVDNNRSIMSRIFGSRRMGQQHAVPSIIHGTGSREGTPHLKNEPSTAGKDHRKSLKPSLEFWRVAPSS
jgi:hypothetical protein